MYHGYVKWKNNGQAFQAVASVGWVDSDRVISTCINEELFCSPWTNIDLIVAIVLVEFYPAVPGHDRK
jgi:hypothetical protein